MRRLLKDRNFRLPSMARAARFAVIGRYGDNEKRTEEGSMTDEKVWTEELKVRGEALLAQVKDLVREGNVRRITIKDGQGKTLIEIPMTIGVVGALVAPVVAAIGAIAALLADCKIVVERREPARPDAKDDRKAG